MASRRSRIKGIANIPQRRKPINEESQVQLKEEIEAKNISENEGVEVRKYLGAETVDNKNETSNELVNTSEFKFPQPCEIPDPNSSEILDTNSTRASNENDKIMVHSTIKINTEDDNLEAPTKSSNKPSTNNLLFKRKFLKIPVSLNAIKKNKKVTTNDEKISSNSNQALESCEQYTKIYEENCDNTEPRMQNSMESNINKKKPIEGIQKPQIIEDIQVPNITSENIFQKPISIMNTTAHSDTEYPLPPPSPNKANRSRIKAIPRLAYRKTSFSASESEDESRKINRIRTDSICSTTSVVADPLIEGLSPQRQKESALSNSTKVLPKKTGRSEQTRKLAEARREFIRRFGAAKPERHRLTMMDLIFYNPESNPMAKEEKDAFIEDEEALNNPDDIDQENADNPNPTEDTAKSDEENNLPVPQIKIGPSGEIILDEQSLLIESKSVDKQREKIQKTKVIDADTIKTGYGIYKKHQRSKYWSPAETLRFYKALNTIGTDFMLMCELFPNRARRELKIKFKKEEKMNRHLIDRALMQPCAFDFEDLKNEIEMEERELEELRKHKEDQKKQREEKTKEATERLMEKCRKKEADQITKKRLPVEVQKVDEEKEKNHKPKRRKKDKLSIKSFMSDSDADESDIATQSESDEDLVLSRKPTRSGRVPKVVQRYEDELASINYVMKKNKVPSQDQPSKIEPGSIMIISEDLPSGEPVYKIYMVTPEQKATKLDLSSDAIAKAIQLKKGVTAESIMTISANVTDDEEEGPQENNVTIPADESVTTLKSNKNTISESTPFTNDVKNVNSNMNENLDIKMDTNKIIDTDFSENIKVIATDKDGILQENSLVFNDLGVHSQFVLEVNSDISSNKNNEERISTEENITIPRDSNIVILRMEPE